MQKVYFLRLMPVCVGLIILAVYFCHSCLTQIDNNFSLIKVDWLAACIALQSRRQLCARAPFNQEGNFVRTPFLICQATLIIHPFHIIHCVHYSLCALFNCAHCSIVLSLTLIKES